MNNPIFLNGHCYDIYIIDIKLKVGITAGCLFMGVLMNLVWPTFNAEVCDQMVELIQLCAC